MFTCKEFACFLLSTVLAEYLIGASIGFHREEQEQLAPVPQRIYWSLVWFIVATVTCDVNMLALLHVVPSEGIVGYMIRYLSIVHNTMNRRVGAPGCCYQSSAAISVGLNLAKTRLYPLVILT